MDGGRRLAVSPRPCSGRRIVASKKRGRADGFVNSVKKLQRREICSKRHRAFSITDAQERFRNIRLQEEYDTHDPKGHCSMVLPFLRKRSKIIEIVAARDIVFGLAQSGVCAAFSRETNHRICFLNVTADEVIRSLFYNKNNDSLITVSVYASDNFSSLKCRSTRIEYIRRGQPNAGFALFESESLKWPGFVEFDDVNGKVLTYSAQDSIYKVFDLKNYTMLYSISDRNVQEIKISPGIMLLIFSKVGGHVPLKILSIEDGTVLKSFSHLLHRNKKVDFIEQFNEKLLVKQENENLQILDVRDSELTEVSKNEFMTPSAFIFLYENQLFLTFRNRTVAVWNFRGELVTSFEDHLLWHPDCNTNNIYITSDQDLIISYCKADSDDPLSEGNASINISNILTGKCLAKIRASNSLPVEKQCSCSSKTQSDTSRIRSTVAEALEDITALFYDEERNEIYTGLWQQLDLYEVPDWETPKDTTLYKQKQAQRRVFQFLNGLNADWDVVKARILENKHALSLWEVLAEVRREESRRSLMLPSVPLAENFALVTQSSSSSRTKKDRSICDFCKKVGHLKDQCWKLHGKLGDWKPSSSQPPPESHSKKVNPELDSKKTIGNARLHNRLYLLYVTLFLPSLAFYSSVSSLDQYDQIIFMDSYYSKVAIQGETWTKFQPSQSTTCRELDFSPVALEDDGGKETSLGLSNTDDLPIAKRKEVRQCTKYPIQKYVAYDNLMPSFRAFIACIDKEEIPTIIEAALKDPKWNRAVVENNDTWIVTDLPHGKKSVGSKWVFTIKYNYDGSIQLYKAKHVAKGFAKTYCIDCKETFAPVAKPNTVRVLLSLTVNRDWSHHQLDIKNAFLNDKLEEEVYMKMPPRMQSKLGEYRALALEICEGIWLLRLLKELDIKYEGNLELFSDSQSTIQIANNPVHHDHIKHVKIDRHFIEEKVNGGIVNLTCVPTEEQLADVLTKALSKQVFEKFLSKLGNGDRLRSEGSVRNLKLKQVETGASVENTNEKDEMLELLNGFKDVFATPEGLPATRNTDHAIHLEPGKKPVNVKPYRRTGPGDCVDYCALNAITIKDKFPIPTADELGNACFFSKLDFLAGYHQIRLCPGICIKQRSDTRGTLRIPPNASRLKDTFGSCTNSNAVRYRPERLNVAADALSRESTTMLMSLSQPILSIIDDIRRACEMDFELLHTKQQIDEGNGHSPIGVMRESCALGSDYLPIFVGKELKQNLHQAQMRMKTHADKNRRELQLEEGSWAFIRLQPYRQLSLRLKRHQKLSPRFFGPYQILKPIGVVAYKLDLPVTTRIHPVFHISQLKPYKDQPHQQITLLPLPGTACDDDQDGYELNLEDKVLKPGECDVMEKGDNGIDEEEGKKELVTQQGMDVDSSTTNFRERRKSSRERKIPKALTDFILF
ncbi:putative pterin-4-alpha-carbinolamine dehydratase-like [Hibiscus syriacus]|uniref:Pterin-4-alpha-carbinolamine dehydratase-like n=1 Tax=Hibiscus syriacus TaxID=106335 RepID=A0A6A3AFV7_HIBSY|nr:putative pterin-4-alpha-carbinolamine dehydratase-like [Hibiscus syriacus]